MPSNEPESKKKWRFNIPYASVTSTFALMISCLTFYFSNLREVHSLQIGVVRTSSTASLTNSVDFTTDLIILNRGNRTEAVMSIEFAYPIGKPSKLDSGAYYSKATQGPYVLKAGDAITIHLKDRITVETFKKSGTWTGENGKRRGEFQFEVVVHCVSPYTGLEIESNVMKKDVFYDEQKDEISFGLGYFRNDWNLYDLLEEESSR